MFGLEKHGYTKVPIHRIVLLLCRAARQDSSFLEFSITRRV